VVPNAGFYQKVRCSNKEIRRMLIRRFPYGIFYVVKDDAVVVLAVLHGRRDPSIIAARSTSDPR